MEVLGHSEIGVTMNTYAHVLPQLREEAADAIDELFAT
jgi:integrase